MHRPCLLCCVRAAAPGSLLCERCGHLFSVWRRYSTIIEMRATLQMQGTHRAWVRIWHDEMKGEQL